MEMVNLYGIMGKFFKDSINQEPKMDSAYGSLPKATHIKDNGN